jgi:hypothetical protein
MDYIVYLIALVIGIIVGLRFRKNAFNDADGPDNDYGSKISFDAIRDAIKDGEAKVVSKITKKSKKEEAEENIPKRRNPFKAIDGKWLVGAIIVCLVLTAIENYTYAYTISSYPFVLFWFALALIIGYFISLNLRIVRDSGKEGMKYLGISIAVAIFFPILFTFISIYVALVMVIAVFLYLGYRSIYSASYVLPTIKGLVAMFCVSLLIMGLFNPLVHPEGINNTLYKSIEANETKAPQTGYVDKLSDIRVISWDLATQYLQRSYGESASVFETDPTVLATNTDPSYVDGKFVWVNAPQYQFLKWTGGKDVPFFVYVVNEPEKMTNENPDIVHKINTTLVVQKERIEWKNRIWNLMFKKYSAQYEVTQIRIDIDDSHTPYWIVYLSERDLQYNMPNLKKILIVSVSDWNDYTEYDVNDAASIPSWLEVVYPDQYVYTWVKYWGSYRSGLVYSWFNKKHLYDPDDSARFIIIQNKTYWQIPVRQKDSEVLGGFVQVDTRTGKATFWNREAKSYVGMWTVEQQIFSYLSSGQVGFQQMTIHEGYLYPIKMDDNSVREAYIFPLYAGFTVQKYAIVDAELYTAAPTIDTSLQDALDAYRAKGPGGGNQTNLTWQTLKIANAYSETANVVVTFNDTHTYSVAEDDLKAGLINQPKDEFKELKLAVAEHDRTGNVTIDVVFDHGKIVDVDYLGADLVKRP